MRGGVQGDRWGQVGGGPGGDQTLRGRGKPAQPDRQAQVRARGGRGPGQGGQDGGGWLVVQAFSDGQNERGGVVVAGGVVEGGQQVGVGQPVGDRGVPQPAGGIGVDPPQLGRQPRTGARVQAAQGRGTAKDRGAGGQVTGRDQERRSGGVGSLGLGQHEARTGQGCGDEPFLVVQDPAQRVTGVASGPGRAVGGRGGVGVVQDREQGRGVQVQGRRGPGGGLRRCGVCGQDGRRGGRR